MASTAQYATTPRIGSASIGLGDVSRVAPMFAKTVLAAGTGGTRIDNIDIVGRGTTIATVVRLWLSDGTVNELFREVPMAATTPSSTVSVATTAYSTISNDFMPIILPTGWSLKASVNDTQTGSAYRTHALVGSTQAVSSGVNALLNGSLSTAANATSIATGQTTGAAGFLTLQTLAGQLVSPALISLTSTGNLSTVQFLITGVDGAGQTISQSIAGPNNNTVFTTIPFAAVNAIYANGAVGTSTSAGIATVCRLPNPANITLSSTGVMTGVTFTLVGVDSNGLTVTETLVGPAAGDTVESVRTYAVLSRITPGGTVSEVRIGTGEIQFGFDVIARAGDF